MAGKPLRKVLSSAKTGRYSVAAVDRTIQGVHVSRLAGGKWRVLKPNETRFERVFATEEDAVACAERLAKPARAVIFIHRPGGSVQKRLVGPSKR